MNLFYLLDDINYIGDNFCETKEVLSVIRMVGYILLIAKLVAPIIIIVLGTIKFYSAIKDGSSDSTLKNAKSLIVRVFVGIFIFFLPTLIHAVLYNFISDDSKTCEVCLLKPGSCDPGDPGSIDTSDGNESQTGSGNNSGGSGNTGSGNTDANDPKCTNRNTSKKYCEKETSCEWDETSKKCGYKDTADNCEYKCGSQYTPGTKAHLDCIDKCSDKNKWKTCEEIDVNQCENYKDRCKLIATKDIVSGISIPGYKCVDKDYVDYSNSACEEIPAASCGTQYTRCKVLNSPGAEKNGKCVDIDYDPGYCSTFTASLECNGLSLGKCEWNNGKCRDKEETVIKDCSSYDFFGCPTDYCVQDILTNKCVNK